MLGISYLILCAAFGICFVGLTVPDVRRLYVACSSSAKTITHIPNTLFTVPAGIITGMLCVPFFNYYVTLGLSYVIDNGNLCKKLSVLITFAFFIWMILTCLILINRKRIKREELKASGATTIEDYEFNIVDSVFYGLVILAITVAATFLMFYTYRIDDGKLMNGYSTFSDLSPHTAMVSSFGKGFNFPTQYMHFSGDGIKYHFLFYYFAGVLQYLGLPIDYALNLPSIISMVCALVLLGLLAILISSRRASFLVAPLLVFFRSSLNVFIHIKELLGSGSTPVQALKSILDYNLWYKATEYDDWGIWAINVYPNQRHLMLGIAVIVIMVILFLPFVRRLGISVSRSGSFGEGVKAFAFSKNAWLTRSGDPLYPVSIIILASVLVIVMPYFHGSCLIALLLILFGMALISESRLAYLVVAVCAVASSYIQTRAFSGGYKNVVTFAFEPGFVLEDVSLASLARYLIIVTGLTLVLGAVYAIVTLFTDIARRKPVHRFLLFLCVLNPMIFAFIIRVSLEMLANHKFIQVSLILVDVFVAALISNLLYVPFKIRKNEEDEISDDDYIIDESALDSEPAVAAATGDAGVRTPVVANISAFGQALDDDDGESDTLDNDDADSDTGIDADIKGLTGGSDDTSDTESGIVDEELPSELLFGDDKTDESSEDENSDEEDAENTSEENEPEDKPETDEDSATASDTDTEEENAGDADSEEAKAGVAAIAALFGEEITEEKSDGKADADDTGDSSESSVASDESEEGIKESAPEPAHVAMRPGSIALQQQQQVQFGEEEPVEEDENVTVISDSEEVEVASAASESDEKEQELKPESLEHKPIKPKKAKGLPLPAWIALEIAGVLLAVILLVPLTATGVSEWATYVNLNKGPGSINTNSAVTKWIVENTDTSDVFLTPNWSMNRFILAGRPMYYGWPYYAWSAGHDTYTRDAIYLWLISGCGDDIDEFTRYCKERHIRYLIIDPEFESAEFENGIKLNKQFFEENLTQAAYFSEENTTIYRIY